MPDDLRARIAAIQVGHYPWLYDRTLACTCGEYRSEPDLFRQWGDHLADAVIRELGLRREGHPSETITNEQGATFYREGGHRYVTEWIADE